MPDLHVAVVSADRALNVPGMVAHIDGPHVWYVPPSQAAEYRYAGAGDVVGVAGLCAARNVALDAAAGRPCIQVSDDLVRLQWTESSARAAVQPITFQRAVQRLLGALEDTPAALAGCAPTANPYFYRQPINTRGFIVGDLFAVAADCPLRFDTRLPLKEDYDYTCQHLGHYGRVARVDGLLVTFKHRTNRGGACAYRTAELEQQAIAILCDKWPDAIRANPRRANEVLLRWRP